MQNTSIVKYEKNQNILSNIATCWSIYLKNGEWIGFTDHDADLTVQNKTYVAKGGINSTNLVSTAGFAADNMDIAGVIDNELIREDDIACGKYNGAEVLMFMVDYNKPDGAIVKLKKAWITDVKQSKNGFVAELRGLTDALHSAKLGEVYSPSCKTHFCSTKCGLKMVDYEHKKIPIVKFIDNHSVQIDIKHLKINAQGKIHGFGLASEHQGQVPRLLKFGSALLYVHDRDAVGGKKDAGAQNSVSVRVSKRGDDGYKNSRAYNMPDIRLDVRSLQGDILEFMTAIPEDLKNAQYLNLSLGCDKQFSTCAKIYDNAENFRGEPHMPIQLQDYL